MKKLCLFLVWLIFLKDVQLQLYIRTIFQYLILRLFFLKKYESDEC